MNKMKDNKKYKDAVKLIRDEFSINELLKLIELAQDVIDNRKDGGYNE